MEPEMPQGAGLAQQMAGQTQPQVSVDQVVALLQQGVGPEELVQQGIPVEVIKEAIQMLLQAEQQAQGVQVDSGQQMQEPGMGLARMAAGGM